jgi:hypothetical protein
MRECDQAAATLRQLIMGFRTTQLIHVAAKLGLADRLQQGPQTAAALAQAVGAEPQALYRLLRALASIGIFSESGDGRFVLTPLARRLQSGAERSQRGLALLYGEQWIWHAYGRMLDSVQTGAPAFEEVHGEPLFQYLAHHPAAATRFQDAMSDLSAQEAAAILAVYDFSNVARVVDVGGGHGSFLVTLLRPYPRLSGVVFDLPAAAAGAQRLLADDVAPRAKFVAGDFFDSIPSGGDLYLLKSVIHNWDDAAAAKILHRVREAMADGARLLVIERVIPPGNTPAEAKLFDINMLTIGGGRERTEREHRALFDSAGFTLKRVIPTDSPVSLIEGLPA